MGQGMDTSHLQPGSPLVVDCDRCLMADSAACDDCVVAYLTAPGGPLVLEADERRALDALADAGLVPGLRLVTRHPPRSAAG